MQPIDAPSPRRGVARERAARERPGSQREERVQQSEAPELAYEAAQNPAPALAGGVVGGDQHASRVDHKATVVRKSRHGDEFRAPRRS
jgi:hypothetical protein